MALPTTFTMIILVLVIALVSFILVNKYGWFNDSFKCPETGVWTAYSCDITVASTKSFSKDKDHEGENCCMPIVGREKEFKKWAKSIDALSAVDMEGSEQSNDVEFVVGDITFKTGEKITIDAADSFKVSAIKKTKTGDKCIFRIYRAHLEAEKIISLDEGPSEESKKFNDCTEDTILNLGELKFSTFKESDLKDAGLYVFEVKIYDSSSETEFPYKSYLQSTITVEES